MARAKGHKRKQVALLGGASYVHFCRDRVCGARRLSMIKSRKRVLVMRKYLFVPLFSFLFCLFFSACSCNDFGLCLPILGSLEGKTGRTTIDLFFRSGRLFQGTLKVEFLSGDKKMVCAPSNQSSKLVCSGNFPGFEPEFDILVSQAEEGSPNHNFFHFHMKLFFFYMKLRVKIFHENGTSLFFDRSFDFSNENTSEVSSVLLQTIDCGIPYGYDGNIMLLLNQIP